MLSKYGLKAKAIAGGTDLLVKMKNKEIKPQYLIRLNNIAQLDYIKTDDRDGLRIGSLATLTSVETSPLVRERIGFFAQAVQQMASHQIRNLATIGGNLCNAAPSADTASPLLVLGAKLKIVNSNGEKIIPIEDFFTGPEQTILDDGELLEEILIPTPPPFSGGIYIKHTIRRAMDLAILGVAVMITLDSDMKCKEVRIALGAAAPTPIRAFHAEDALKGNIIDNQSIEETAQIAMDESHPRTSIRATSEYRKKMAKVLVRRALSQAREEARAF
jgi:carbon-monoxide dehydrogenase medium subunit